jgi:hypothetical protein
VFMTSETLFDIEPANDSECTRFVVSACPTSVTFMIDDGNFSVRRINGETSVLLSKSLTLEQARELGKELTDFVRRCESCRTNVALIMSSIGTNFEKDDCVVKGDQ